MASMVVNPDTTFSFPSTGCANRYIDGCNFANFLTTQEPVYDKLILKDVRPTDGWIGHISVGTWDSYSGVTHTIDRFRHVFPNLTAAWQTVPHGICNSGACDPDENCIGIGMDRKTYYLERQSWRTDLFCYDTVMHMTHAREHFRQIISDVLKPVASTVMSNFIRKRAVTTALAPWLADATMTNFTAQWNGPTALTEYWLDVSGLPTSKLTPQMLQRRVSPLQLLGYNGTEPFKDAPPFIELVTDMETAWELDKLATSGGAAAGMPSIQGNWRFQQWDAANKFWRYGYSGQLGNYMVRVDPMQMRFNYRGPTGNATRPFRLEQVFPYVNQASTGTADNLVGAGLGSTQNPHWQTARYGMSFIWHRKAMDCLVADATPVNPEMPYSARNFGGKWRFVMDNLGADCNGNVIENKRRNKGMFIADFKLAIRPMYVEWCEPILHLREPACIVLATPCSADACYPASLCVDDYNSCNCSCECHADDAGPVGATTDCDTTYPFSNT